MPASYLQDEDTDELPFYLRNRDADSFDTGDPADLGAAPSVGLPQPEPPTPQMRAIFGQQPRLNPNDAPVVQDANKAREAAAEAKANVPVPVPPKWWQRLGAGIIGGMAGYANASGHRGVRIDPTGAEQGIMGAGKYQQDLAAYNANVTGAQAKADAATANESAWWRNRQLNNQEDLQQAQAERDRAQAGYNESRNATSEEGRKLAANEKLEQQLVKPWGEDAQLQRETDPVPPGMETTRSITQPGMVYVHPPRYVKITDDLAPYAAGRKAGDVVSYSEFKRAQANAAKDTLQQNKPVKAPADNVERILLNPGDYTPQQRAQAERMFNQTHREPRDPNTRRPPTSQEMRGIEAKKNDRLNALETQAQRRVAQGEDKDTVYSEMGPDKQRIQNEYEGEIQAATGNYPGHMDLSTQPKPAPAAAPPAAPQVTGGGRGGGRAAQQPPVKEGDFIRNKQTGERRVLQGGQWVPAA